MRILNKILKSYEKTPLQVFCTTKAYEIKFFHSPDLYSLLFLNAKFIFS